ncbi:MAG: bifunctional diguanylate cyclase/phosphohydrolase [Pirellulaceae bacterium]
MFMDSSPTLTAESPFASLPAAPAADQPPGTSPPLIELGDFVLHGNLIHEPVPVAPRGTTVELKHQNELVQVRLGLASSLFAALRARHAATAAHCLRVALGCSSWGPQLSLQEQQRDELEVAALLHDIGKIGVPDRVLLKPYPLTRDDRALLDQRRTTGEQILLSCCASQNVLTIVKYAPAWYDGSRPGFDRYGQQLPLEARVVSIIDAYDAMTSEQIYRRAKTSEWALAELFACSGTQFDPELVEQFCDLLTTNRIGMTEEVSRRWLHELNADKSNDLWRRSVAGLDDVLDSEVIDKLFHEKLLDSMHDGVIFIDTRLSILLWNRAAERLTGRTASQALHQRWAPEFIGMRDEQDQNIDADHSPVELALHSRIQTLNRLTIQGPAGERVSVDAHAVPVIGRDGVMHGATLLLHDASSQINLEERVQSLHVRATHDALTRVANRAEFDRVQAEFVDGHQHRARPCALIMCDIDHFKTVNDTFGHQAGDEVLVHFAAMLQRSCRQGDLVARYGGEEFVILCADCDNATVTQRAEMIRRELEMTPHPSLDSRPITASFGVTELQAGDTPETMLRRADRALMRAKESGRNRVVQLGTGIPLDAKDMQRRRWYHWLQPSTSTHLLEETLVTAVPLAVTMEKLRGFVSDHHAEIVATEDGKLQLQITKQSVSNRHATDRPVSFLVAMQFVERGVDGKPRSVPGSSRTIIHVTICLANNRDRRQENAYECARQLFASLKSYFMAQSFDGSFDPNEAWANPAFFKRLLTLLHLWSPAPDPDQRPQRQ